MKMFNHVRRALLGTIVAMAAIGGSGVLWAQEPGDPTRLPGASGPVTAVPATDPPTTGAAAAGDEAAMRPRPARDDQARHYEVSESIHRQLQSGQGAIHIYQLLEEMIDEVVADVSKLNATVVSPVAVRNLTLTPNLSAQLGDIVEGTLISAIANNTTIAMKRCAACRSLRSRVEDGDWVVTLGLSRHEDLQLEATRLGAQTYMDARVSFFPGANVVALQVEIFRASDGAILWTETYRSDATTAAILRSGDRVLSRAERVKELERKIDARPYYGHILYLGGAYIPYDHPAGGISGMAIGYRLYEKFGEDRRILFGIGAEGFANFSEETGLLGSFVSGTLQYEVFAPNLNAPVVRTGPTVGGFFAGTEGNSFFAEWGLDVVMQFRLGAGISAFYFLPTEFGGYDLGGFGARGRVSFNW